MKIIIQSIKNYFKSKKDRGLEPVFFEKIGDQKTSRDQMRENLIKALKKNGWTIKKINNARTSLDQNFWSFGGPRENHY